MALDKFKIDSVILLSASVLKTLNMPRVDPVMEKGVVLKWIKADGGEVAEKDHLLTIMTEKIEFEIYSPGSGRLKILVEEGMEVPVGERLAVILEAGDSPEAAFQLLKEASLASVRGELKVSPAARRLAEEHGVDLKKIIGSGPEGRIVREDIEKAISEATGTGIRTVKVSPLRRTIAEKMLLSHRTIPPVTVMREVDAAQLVSSRRKMGVSYDALIVRSAAKALGEYLILNSSFEGEQIKVSEKINIGVAVATEDALLVVVVRDADKKNVMEISREIEDLSGRAREGNLSIVEVSGGTFTVSNLGVFGVEEFTPIVVPGQSAILGVGAIKRRPVAVEEKVEVGERLTLSLTFDHRAADGAAAAKFLNRLAELLESGRFED